MPCGHGGFCVACSIDIIKKQNKCFLCRFIIEEFYVVEHNNNGISEVKKIYKH